MVYKSLNSPAPDYLAEMFIDRSNITNYTLRDSSGKLAIPQPRTDYIKNSFSYSGAVLWNSLPSDLRQASSLQKFKADCSNLFQYIYIVILINCSAFMKNRYMFDIICYLLYCNL